MARFNEILVGRYNRFVQKLFSMKGPATMPQVAGELQPVVPFFNGVENRYIESWTRWGSAPVQVAVAAQNTAIRLRNPAGSNVIAVLEKLLIVNGATDVIVLVNQAGTADLGTAFGSKPLDLREGTGSGATLIQSGGNNVAGGVTWGGVQVQANTSFDVILFEEQEITIVPGDTMDVRNTTVNNALRLSLIWRERFLEDSERS